MDLIKVFAIINLYWNVGALSLDPCKTADDGSPSDCHRTTASEGCPSTSEFLEWRLEKHRFCCCPCLPNEFTREGDWNALRCHPSTTSRPEEGAVTPSPTPNGISHSTKSPSIKHKVTSTPSANQENIEVTSQRQSKTDAFDPTRNVTKHITSPVPTNKEGTDGGFPVWTGVIVCLSVAGFVAVVVVAAVIIYCHWRNNSRKQSVDSSTGIDMQYGETSSALEESGISIPGEESPQTVRDHLIEDRDSC